MLATKQFRDITIYRMGRSIGKFVPYCVHSFLIGDMLVDTGTAYARAEFLAALRGRRIATIVNTHFHEDHIGNNAPLQQALPVEVLAHVDSVPYMAEPKLIGLKPYQKFVWKRPEGSTARNVDGSIAISGHTFRVIHTRGHSEGHICLYEPSEKWLFTGDMFCGVNNIYLRADENFNQLLASLEELAALEIDTLFCGLKGAVADGGGALRAKIAFMKKQRDLAIGLFREGISPKRIRAALLGREDMMFYVTGGHFSKQNLINSILEEYL